MLRRARQVERAILTGEALSGLLRYPSTGAQDLYRRWVAIRANSSAPRIVTRSPSGPLTAFSLAC
jgi:hypothetical protein